MKFLGSKSEGRIKIFGVPFDSTVSFSPGTRFGPEGIRKFSQSIETFSFVLGKDLESVEFEDCGDLEVSRVPEKMIEEVERFVEKIDLPVVLGGEHTVSYPVVKSLLKRYKKLTVVQFDAHADLRNEYEGTKFSHACVMRRILEEGCSLIQVGVRSESAEERKFFEENSSKILRVDLKELPKVLENCQNPVYFSIDIDFFNPSEAPGTGNPEPPGVFSKDFFDTIYKINGINLVGFDLVEVSPPLDFSGITQILSARIVRELILKFWG